MKNRKVLIETILASDQVGLTAMQKKLNQWMTVGLLVKYEMHTTATHIVFNICVKKEADKV
jgi:hypothetical protein